MSVASCEILTPACRPLVGESSISVKYIIGSLLLINGGAIIALLEFLQAIWTSAEKLIPWIVSGLIPLALGVATVAAIPLLRAETVLFWTDAGGRGERMMRLYRWLAASSVVLFLAGVVILIVGVFVNLPAG